MDASGDLFPGELVFCPEASSGHLILTGPAGDVCILQMASLLTATEGRQVGLVGGARAPIVSLQPGTSAALVMGPMPDEATDADPSVTFISGPTQDEAASTRAGTFAAGCGMAEETGGDIQWQ